jgi:predicted TIM-barrel fold metal-dependent hydrolase
LYRWSVMTGSDEIITLSHRGARLRGQLDHPVIDADGHGIEFLPLVRDHLVDLAGGRAGEAFDDLTVISPRLVQRLRPAQRRAFGSSRASWWTLPARNTLDRATCMLPALMAERLPDLGIDHAIVYPTYGLVVTPPGDDELRQALARAFNLYYAEAYADHRDRLTPVGVIPMHTPQEAVAELNYATRELGLTAFTFAAPVGRAAADGGSIQWVDSIGIDSPYDYDPLWQRCVDLGVSPTFHASAMTWHTHASVTNYIYNHLGMFATACDMLVRAFVLGGVPTRFPTLRFAFQEGGIGWAAALYAGLIGHWEKRNGTAVDHYNPAHLDQAMLRRLFERHAGPAVGQRLDRLGDALDFLSLPDEPIKARDEFALSGIESPEDITRIFTEQFFFGCEADDPLTAVAFDDKRHLLGATLNPLFGSDIGHWDVPDIEEVLEEAWELVEHGHLDRAEFEAFTFTNPARLWGETNPAFFRGTTVEAATAALLPVTLP